MPSTDWGDISGYAIPLLCTIIWITICLLYIRAHKRDFGLLVFSCYSIIAIIIIIIAGYAIFGFALHAMPGLTAKGHSSGFLRLFIIGALVMSVGHATFVGWATSPGGMRVIFLPVLFLSKWWPPAFGPLPVTRDEAKVWSRFSTVAAVGIFALQMSFHIYAWQKLAEIIHSTPH